MGLAMGCKEELCSPDGATFANWVHADLSTIIWLHTHKYIHKHIHTCMHAYNVHTYIHTYIHACIHTAPYQY